MTEKEKTYRKYGLYKEDVDRFISNLIFQYDEDERVDLISSLCYEYDFSGICILKIVHNFLDWIILTRERTDEDLIEKWYYTGFIDDIKILKETVEKHLTVIKAKNGND